MAKHRRTDGQNVTARTIVDALAAKHKEDVFVPECKDGPTHSAQHSRMDAWAMKRSWAHPLTLGYEVKVSRADFVQDTKWPGYLPLCNEFYWAAPKGLIKPDEINPECGLIELVGQKRLVVRKRAVYRDIPLDPLLACYVLMCRVRIVNTTYLVGGDETDMTYWREWAERKSTCREIGHMASRKMREVVAQRITEVESENRRLEAENKELAQVKEMLAGLGVPLHSWQGAAKEARERLTTMVPRELVRDLANARDRLTEALAQIDAATKGAQEGATASESADSETQV